MYSSRKDLCLTELLLKHTETKSVACVCGGNLPRVTLYLLKAYRGQGNEAKWFLKIKVPTINRFEIRAAQLQPATRWQQNFPHFAAICWVFDFLQHIC